MKNKLIHDSILCKVVLFLHFTTCHTNKPMMQFTTKTELPIGELHITHESNMILIGSCFAGNIGSKLSERKFRIDANPFGVQYNPMSIASVLKRISSGEPFGECSEEIFEHNGQWHSIMHHSDFSDSSKGGLLVKINSRLRQAHNAAKGCDLVIVTLGTAYAYSRKSDGRIVGNCHKLPAREFNRRLLGIDEIVAELGNVIEIYRRVNRNVKFLFTISPIRHLRDGAHDNQKSKSTLLLAVDELIKRYSCCYYFPAYEIVLDELRDYRFYADDMLHPSAVAVKYIWECFDKCYFSDATRELNSNVEEITRGLEHRPFDAESDGYRKFIGSLVDKINYLTKRHPGLDFGKEIRECNTLLKR